MGRMLAAQVDKEAKFVDDPIITEYVNRVGQNIVLHSDAKVPFTIKVIDSDEVNAFALPGGFFYVNKGLILAADNEAELAGVMAHEIAHVCARHAMENEAQDASHRLWACSQAFCSAARSSATCSTTAAGSLKAWRFLKFSRGAEEEADKLGVQYMWAAGYDPGAMATMFEKLEAKNKKKPGTISSCLRIIRRRRIAAQSALALAARFPEREEYVISSSEFQRVKNRLLRLSNARVSSNWGDRFGLTMVRLAGRRSSDDNRRRTTRLRRIRTGRRRQDPNKPARRRCDAIRNAQPTPTPQP